MADDSKKPRKIERSRVVVCEGPHHRAFLQALHDERRLPAAQILCAHDFRKSGGSGGFKEFLHDIIGWSGFQGVTDVIVVTDSDADPAASFRKVRRQIQDVAATTDLPSNYPVPRRPQTKTLGSPSIAVLMVPWDDCKGALETLCYEAAARARPEIAACVHAFLSCCSGTDGLPPQKFDKVRLRSWIAAALKENPDKNLKDIWQEKGLIPLEDSAFDQIAEFFANFA